MKTEGRMQASAAPTASPSRGGVLAWLSSRLVRRKPDNLDATAGTRIRFNLHTLSWVGVCITMAYAGAAQSNGAAYLLAFTAGALGVMSYVYARANLRGLEIRVGANPIQSGGQEVLPVELRAASGHMPCGLEVLLAGSPKAAFVEQIPAGQSVRLHLRLPAARGVPLKLLLRSSYPLGLLHAQRVVNVELTRHAVPPASGNLPLPSPADKAVTSGGNSRSSQQTKPGREGDDFAGVREWNPGDSPRHIDWRAVARGRPLMVKTWASGLSESVSLDWESMPLPQAERAGQMVRWIQTAEQQGLAYSLNLPELKIPAGQGESHAKRCLQAVAALHAGSLAAAESNKPLRVPPSHEYNSEVSRGPLILLSAVLFLTALPLRDLVPLAALGVLLLSLFIRNFHVRPLPGKVVPLAMTAVGIASVYFSLGTLLTMEAGIAVLIVLSGGKLLESRTPHDFQVMAMVGWFLCLCGLLADQSIARSIWMFTSFATITGCMMRFRRGVPGWKEPTRQTFWLLLQALPLVLLLFVVFPRFSLDYLQRMSGGRTNVTGVSSSLDPGKVLELAKSTATAFRVEFPDGQIPPNHERYWRCVVLWDCHGLSWTRGLNTSYAPQVEGPLPGDVRQLITLEPHGQVWLPALDVPISYERGQRISGLSSERLLWSHDTVRKVRRVDVTSRPHLGMENLPQYQREAALDFPATLPKSLRDLANQWRQGAKNDGEVVQAGMNYLRTQGYQYTLEPGTYLGPNALEDFMLKRKVGFCEHFSAAFATLMRAADVPSRIVMGYLGGEMSITGTHMIVRQADAHAWVEVWLENSGWTRIDPTAALAPARLTLNLQSYLLGGEEALERQRNSFWWQASQQVRLFMDQMNYQWYQTVISFDEDTQFGWLSWLGFSGMKDGWLFLISISAVLLALVLLTLWLKRPARDPDRWRSAWASFCRRVEKLGLPARRQNEGPLAYAERVAGDRVLIVELARQYASGRYGQEPTSTKAFERAIRDLR